MTPSWLARGLHGLKKFDDVKGGAHFDQNVLVLALIWVIQGGIGGMGGIGPTGRAFPGAPLGPEWKV